MKKMFAWMQSNGNMADENFERMQSNGYTGDAKMCDVPSIFGANSQRERLNTYSMHNFAITDVSRMLVSENDE